MDILYLTNTPLMILNHYTSKPLLIHDHEDTARSELRVYVRSGEYLSTLASRLDDISQTIKARNEAESSILQTYIDDLLYIEANYKLVKNS